MINFTVKMTRALTKKEIFKI